MSVQLLSNEREKRSRKEAMFMELLHEERSARVQASSYRCADAFFLFHVFSPAVCFKPYIASHFTHIVGGDYHESA
jgi:hypothetical protein